MGLKKYISSLLIFVFVIFAGYIIFGLISTFMGWDAYEKWKFRKHSNSIQESIRRGVFEKKLNYIVEGYEGVKFEFEPFIERGFRWGRRTSEETIPIDGSNFPYQLSYNNRLNDSIGILMRQDQYHKFDSSIRYLRSPNLPDTIIFKIEGKGVVSGIIKVW